MGLDNADVAARGVDGNARCVRITLGRIPLFVGSNERVRLYGPTVEASRLSAASAIVVPWGFVYAVVYLRGL